jgi:hypothetical protein
MVSERLLAGAFAVVFILVIASIAYAVLLVPPSQPSALEQMTLTSNDLGTGWTSHFEPLSPNDLNNYVGTVTNETFSASVHLEYFQNHSICWFEYDNFSKEVSHAYHNETYENITLGSAALLYYLDSSNAPGLVGLVFIEKNVLCHILVDELRFSPNPWSIDTTNWVAQLQFDKIDQYLVEHPGAI